ncbi:capsid protein [Burkholderia ubonensis]|uniref:phage major capsid protein n=1 Tax=Burkholderia ubonensis TaxID=101571 RepID=UPI00075773E6|nr:phage major capsid protein [Burkholderia ubonensis]KVU27555.1 capsid protein [Burkholderia ubonensis]KVU65314.1 capsid protein [Burkholderia ubonensis]KWH16354.1 capsid protein [Burkholderia ubonensis]
MEALREIKELVQQQGQAWEEFKKQNDARIAVLEKGGTGSDYDAKLASINTALDELKTALKDVETKRNRIDLPGVGGEDDPEYKSAFVGFVRKGANEHELREKAVNTGSDADGGIAVPQEVDRNILQLLERETPMREVADVITVSTDDYKKIVNLGGTGSGWVGETDQRPNTPTSKLAAIASYFGEIYANPAATQRSLDDLFFDVEAWMSGEVVKEFTEQENAAYTAGDGVKKPKGFLAYNIDNKRDDKRDFGTLQFVGSGAALSIGGDGLLDLVYSLKRGYRKNATFMLNGLSVAAVRKLKDERGDYLWQPGLQAGEPDKLLGYSAVENDDMPDIAAGAYPIAFGDFKRGYQIVDRIGIRVLRDPYTNKPYVQFYTTKRVGGGVVDSNALKLLKVDAAAAGGA